MAQTRTAMHIDFRQAAPEDFAYCARLYFAAMAATIRELKLDIGRHNRGLS